MRIAPMESVALSPGRCRANNRMATTASSATGPNATICPKVTRTPTSTIPQRSSARLTGGRLGRVYRLTNRVTLTDGQVADRSVTIRVEER